VILLVGLAIEVAPIPGPSTASASRHTPTYDELLRECKRAKAAAVIDAETGQPLFLYRADESLPPASTVKLMTLLVAAEQLERGHASETDTVVVSHRAGNTGGQQLYLQAGERYTIDELAFATAIHSANDGAVALAEGTFGSYERAVGRMNQRARELGLTHTRFRTPHGLPAGWGQAGDRTSAWDLARLGQAATLNERVMRWCSTPQRVFPSKELLLVSSNKLLGRARGIDGLKTGFTQEAGFCYVGTARRYGRRLVCVVLGADSSRRRFQLAERLLAYGFRGVERQTVLRRGTPIVSRPVRDASQVELIAGQDVELWIDPQGMPSPRLHLSAPDTLDRSIALGDTVGEVLVYLGTRLVDRVPTRVDGDLPDERPWWKRWGHF
jgi:D-alanyl-D-alanine carboxypeptidase (penicillin-binding protein 5/6)